MYQSFFNKLAINCGQQVCNTNIFVMAIQLIINVSRIGRHISTSNTNMSLFIIAKGKPNYIGENYCPHAFI